jgi:hypothetical protein
MPRCYATSIERSTTITGPDVFASRIATFTEENMTTTRAHRWQFIACLTALLAIVALTPAWAQNNGKQQNGEGKFANLTALWWQWVYAQPAVDVGGTNTNPVLDTTGEFAAVGQENGIGPGNKIFFLAGTFGVNVTRTVTVPAGKALFFPMVNFEIDNAVDPPTDYTVPQLRALARATIDTVNFTYARLDAGTGFMDLEIFRTKSPAFDYTVPDGNSLYDYFDLIGPQFEGRIKPAVADGYWAYIPPLLPGDYILEFGGRNPPLLFELNVTYFLTIE